MSAILSILSRHLGARMLDGLHLDGGYARKRDKKGEGDSDGSGSKNNEKAKYGSDPNSTKNAINDKGFKQSFGGGKNDNNNKSTSNKNNPVGNTINNLSSSTGNNQKGGK